MRRGLRRCVLTSPCLDCTLLQCNILLVITSGVRLLKLLLTGLPQSSRRPIRPCKLLAAPIRRRRLRKFRSMIFGADI